MEIEKAERRILASQFQEKRETEKNMEVMWAALRKHPNGIGFLELVMNMQSSAQLCENCFTLSFLVGSSLLAFPSLMALLYIFVHPTAAIF